MANNNNINNNASLSFFPNQGSGRAGTLPGGEPALGMLLQVLKPAFSIDMLHWSTLTYTAIKFLPCNHINMSVCKCTLYK